MDQPPSPPPSRLPLALLLAGGALALVAGLFIAFLLSRGGSGTNQAPPASQAGLVIESSGDDGGVDATRPLRCFVAGQFVGELTLAECARRNGVATDALDVGVDDTGALAASDQAGLAITPLPPADPTQAPADEDAVPVDEPAGACWRYAGGQWRRLPGESGLDACVQSLFAGRCEKPGQASYGRWGQQTLRLVTGRVEISSDNQSFRPLANQGQGCSIPPVG